MSCEFFVAFFDNNNPAFHKTNSSGKMLDTRQKIVCGPLVSGINYNNYNNNKTTFMDFGTVEIYTGCPKKMGD